MDIVKQHQAQISNRMVTIREIRCQTILTSTGGFLGDGYTHTLSPYNGCLFGHRGCGIYCYAQKLFPALKRKEPLWGDWVDVKINAPEVLLRDLNKHKRKGNVKIYMSPITDPFMPRVETTYKISQRCLAHMLEDPPDVLVLQTRSPLVKRVFPLLKQLGSRTRVILSVTIETDRDALQRELLPTNPSVEARLAVCRKAKRNGIFVQATISPMLPNNPDRFAELLEPTVDRVIVDTLVHGDGSKGRRSMSLPVYQTLKDRGHESLFGEHAHDALMGALVRKLGPGRVLFSQAGFNST